MSREIKFRAWNGEAMEYGGFCIHATGKVVSEKGLTKVSTSSSIMQYTGLKDCKGVEIYEGDIVRRIQKDQRGNILDDFIAEVVWHKYATKFVVFPPECDGLECGRSLHFIGYGFVEVIGNIYENSDLIDK